MLKPYYDKGGITIYCGENSEVMKRVIEDNSIDLTVTSPPYDLVDEDMVTHCDKGLRDYQGYEWDFVRVASELWRVTAKGGVVVWVVGDATVNGSETGTSFRQALYFKKIGFNLHDTMIYHTNKPPMNDNRYQSSFEYMFILSKNYVNIFNPILVKSNWGNSKTNPKYKEKSGNTKSSHKVMKAMQSSVTIKKYKIKENIWSIPSGHGKGSLDLLSKNHPATFPEDLARDHILSWSNPGNLIFDPFLGSGTTLKMAQQLGRRGIGIEISEDYCKITVERLRQPSFFSIPSEVNKVKSEQLTLLE